VAPELSLWVCINWFVWGFGRKEILREKVKIEKVMRGSQRGEDAAVAAVLGRGSWQGGIAFQDCDTEGERGHLVKFKFLWGQI